MSMSIVSYDFGHSEGQLDAGANGLVNEYTEVRNYGKVAIEAIERAGHTIVNCTTPDSSGFNQNTSLAYRANKSNEAHADYHLCFHANSYADASANGAEMEVASNAGEAVGKLILEEVTALGFHSRGVKRPSLFMTGANVNAISVLLEPFFITNKEDVARYDAVSLGNAVAKGFLRAVGGEFTPYVPVVSTPVAPQVSYSNTVLTYQKLVNSLGVRDSGGRRLSEDGVIGERTRSTYAKMPVLKQGSRGLAVMFAQSCLGISPDGIFGAQTKSTVVSYQKRRGLVPDGVIGALSWHGLVE